MMLPPWVLQANYEIFEQQQAARAQDERLLLLFALTLLALLAMTADDLLPKPPDAIF